MKRTYPLRYFPRPLQGTIMQSALATLLLIAFLPVASASEPAVSAESLERFLSGLRNFAGGKLTPGPLYDPASVAPPAGNGAISTIGISSPMNYFNSASPASWRAANGTLTGGSIVRSTVTSQRAAGQTVVQQNIVRHR